MRWAPIILVATTLAVMSFAFAQEKTPAAHLRSASAASRAVRNVVPDKDTAQAIGRVLLTRLVGAIKLAELGPLVTMESNGYWTVGNSVHDGAFVKFAAFDCRVVAIGSGKCGSCSLQH